MAAATRAGASPVQARSAVRRGRANTSVTVKRVLSARPAKSSTQAMVDTRGPSAVRWQCTTTSTDSLTRLFSAAMGSSLEASESWQMNRSRARAWRAEPAWMVVNPCTPDDSVSSRGSASRSRTSPTTATSGAMRKNPDTKRRRSTPGRSGRAARVCMLATLASGMSASNTSSATTIRSEGSSSAAQQLNMVVLPEPGAPANTMVRRALTQARRKPAAAGVSMALSTSSSRLRKATPVNLRMLAMTCPPLAMSPWTMCRRAPSSSWASWSPSEGSSLRWAPEARSSTLTRVRTTCSSSWKTSWW